MLITPHHAVARPHLLTTGRPSLFGRTDTAWRMPLAAAAIVAAAAHVPVTPEHLHEALYIGVLFVLLEIASVGLAVALLLRPTRAALLGTAVVGVLAVLALVLSRTIGLPQIGDDVGDWTEPLAVVSLVAEALMTVGALVALLGRGRHRSTRAGLIAGLAVLVVGGIATGVATAAEAAPAPQQHMSRDMPGMQMGLAAASSATE